MYSCWELDSEWDEECLGITMCVFTSLLLMFLYFDHYQIKSEI
jgi:hypothetical protein